MTTGKRLAVHGAVTVLALAAALYAWRHGRVEAGGGDEDPEEVASIVVVPAERADLAAIRFHGGDRRVEIELAKTASDPHWVSVTTKRKVVTPRPRPALAAPTGDGGPSAGDGGPSAGDGGPSAAAEEPRWEESTVRFAGSTAVDKLVAKVAPLRSYRSLGKLTAPQREEFELVGETDALELVLASGPRRFVVGARTVGAGSRFYVLDETTGEGHLLDATIVRDLDMATSRLMQRELHRFEPDAVAKAVLVAGERRRELVHRDRDVAQKAAWVDPSRPGAASKTAESWMRQVQRLRALAYPSTEDRFSGADATALVRIGLFDEGGAEVGFVELAKHRSALEYFARSEATGVWVRVSRTVADQVATDLADVLGE